MLRAPEIVKALSYPHIVAAYLKEDFSDPKHVQNVLVLETNLEANDLEHEAFDEYLIDLLVDLNDLKDQAEKKIGSFDRIDIRTH